MNCYNLLNDFNKNTFHPMVILCALACTLIRMLLKDGYR